MSSFSGFNVSTGKSTPLPAAFFAELLPEIKDAGELKIILWAFRCLNLQSGDLRYLTAEDFSGDKTFFSSLGKTEKERAEQLNKALEGAVHRGVFLKAQDGETVLYFLNSPRGRAALEGLGRGAWQAESQGLKQGSVTVDRPNIFAAYEKNIGPLTPILADELRDAEALYPEDWIFDAFKIAVNKNVRKWNYIEAILRSWKEKGRDERNQRTAKEDRELDSEGEFGEYILH